MSSILRLKEPPTLIDLFAGCGGMTLGFLDAGFQPVLAVEHDLAAAATYAANFGDQHTHLRDIGAFEASSIPSADVIIGGPPCQGFSNLGTRNVDDPRNRLWEQFVRFVKVARPKVFVVENVPRFASSREFANLMRALTTGPLRSYRFVTHAVLNAADYGVPQRRHRAILIASRVGEVALPVPTHSKAGQVGLIPWRTTRDAFGDLPRRVSTTELPNSNETMFGEKVRGIFKGLDIHIGRNPTSRSLDRYALIPPGGNRFDLPDEMLPNCWLKKATGTTDVMGRMRWDSPSLTVRTEFFKPEKGQYLHPQWHRTKASLRCDRPITHLEAARLQTFPDEFLWCGNKGDIARQIGNAVPPLLAQRVAEQVLLALG